MFEFICLFAHASRPLLWQIESLLLDAGARVTMPRAAYNLLFLTRNLAAGNYKVEDVASHDLQTAVNFVVASRKAISQTLQLPALAYVRLYNSKLSHKRGHIAPPDENLDSATSYPDNGSSIAVSPTLPN